MAQLLVSEFNSEVPSTVENLQKLPGVGRKTANVIASVAHQAPAMAVDTHVFRVANRLGLTSKAKTPLAVEKQLVKHLPKDKIHVAHHWLILHGRYICLARNPKCEQCPISWFCKYYEQQHTEAALIKTEKAKQRKQELLKKKKAQQKTESILKKLSIKK
jgi:endonuclease-3